MDLNSIMTNEPPLFEAIRAGDRPSVSVYLGGFTAEYDLPRCGDTTPLMVCVEALFNALQSWHPQMAPKQSGRGKAGQAINARVRILVEVAHFSSYFFDRNSHGQTVLHLVAAAGSTGKEPVSSISAAFSELILECLLPELDYVEGSDEDAVVSNSFWIRCHNKQTSLHTAVVHKNFKAATLLMKHMFKDQARIYRDYRLWNQDMVPQTFLALAVQHHATPEFLTLLLHKFPEAASINDKHDTLFLLLVADIVKSQATPLQFAC